MNGISTSDMKPDDKLFGIKTKMAQVKFFAWADHNQMPLRRIMVDWREKGTDPNDNNTISGVAEGYYTNYKPYCGDDSREAKECVGVKSSTITTEVQNKFNTGKNCINNDSLKPTNFFVPFLSAYAVSEGNV